jgi:two-component system NtrC family sensor kinase
MLGDWSFHRISIKAKLISSYLLILGAGGLATSVVGSWIVSSTLLTQVWRTVDGDFATAKTVYRQKLESVKLPVEVAAAGTTIQQALASGDKRSVAAYLAGIKSSGGVDFLRYLEARAGSAVVDAAFSGKVAAGAEVTPDGMALVSAAPVRDATGKVQGVLYGGTFLRHVVGAGSMTIFQSDTAIGSNGRAPVEVIDAVLRHGQTWRGRNLAGGQWLISCYEPIRDYSGNPVGMLSVGLPENIYTDTRNFVILSFFGIASIGFIVIMGTTYYMIRNITRPLSAMVDATHNIIAGRFDQEVHTDSPGEIAALADSFNAMLHSLRRMKADLEEWGNTLEQKVHQRTEQLAAMQTRMAQSDRLASLGMLAAGVAHEVNNPLGGILALTSLTLEDMPRNDPNRECLEEVIRQTERCRDIVLRLLEFSRQSKANRELVDLNDILERTLALIGKQSMFFNVTVVRQYDADLPTVLADRSQFQQVFMNLLMNAAQAMNERGTLTVTTRRDPAGENVEIAISDTGCGIPPDQIGRVFDPFFTTKASGQGTGLGLSITYGIVTTHGGTITVQSRQGAGTTFTVRVPMASVEESTVA